MTDVTRILSRIEQGEAHAAEELLPLVYEELRRLASQRLAHEIPGQTWQATELVHEAYLRLVGSDQAWEGSGHFFSAAAEAMRRILVERARQKKRIRHGGGRNRVGLNDEAVAEGPSPEEILLVDDLLDRFAEHHPAESQIVKLHYFAGFNISEAARALGLPTSTAHLYWRFAKSWLRQYLSEGRPHES